MAPGAIRPSRRDGPKVSGNHRTGVPGLERAEGRGRADPKMTTSAKTTAAPAEAFTAGWWRPRRTNRPAAGARIAAVRKRPLKETAASRPKAASAAESGKAFIQAAGMVVLTNTIRTNVRGDVRLGAVGVLAPVGLREKNPAKGYLTRPPIIPASRVGFVLSST